MALKDKIILPPTSDVSMSFLIPKNINVIVSCRRKYLKMDYLVVVSGKEVGGTSVGDSD